MLLNAEYTGVSTNATAAAAADAIARCKFLLILCVSVFALVCSVEFRFQ